MFEFCRWKSLASLAPASGWQEYKSRMLLLLRRIRLHHDKSLHFKFLFSETVGFWCWFQLLRWHEKAAVNFWQSWVEVRTRLWAVQSLPCVLPCSWGWLRGWHCNGLEPPALAAFSPQWQRAPCWKTHHNFTAQTKRWSIWRADLQLMLMSDCRHWGAAAPGQGDGAKPWRWFKLSFGSCCVTKHGQPPWWPWGLFFIQLLEHFSTLLFRDLPQLSCRTRSQFSLCHS